MKKRKNNSIFQINHEYYTFISGALISIPISLLFEMGSHYTKYTFWIGLAFSLLTSFFCFKLSILLKDIREKYDSNKKGIGDTVEAWNAAIRDEKIRCIIYLFLTVVTLSLSITCVCLMQLPTIPEKLINDIVSQTTTTIP